RRRHTRCYRDWSSDVCSSDLNWRRLILYLFPNGKAPLTALLSLTEPEETNDPHINWYEKTLPLQRTVLTASFTSAATTINIAARSEERRVGKDRTAERAQEP